MDIGIIECGRNKPEWLARHGGFADWFPPLLDLAGADFSYSTWRADLGELPERIDACDAYLLTGSPHSVTDALPWQRPLSDFIVRVREGRPLVGICYGHQHIHAALGGEVGRRDNWGVGVRSYPVLAVPPWCADDASHPTPAFDLIALHQDHVVVPAPGTVILAGREDCPFAVTQIGDTILTFQPHPEMTSAQARAIYDLHRTDMGDRLWRDAQRSLAHTRSTQLAADWIVRFLNAASRRCSSPARNKGEF